MPGKQYPKLSEQEKQEIIQRHKAMVEEFNAVLPDEYKVAIDEHLEDKLNDEKMVATYRAAQEIKAVEKRQREIRDALEQDYGKYQGNEQNAFSRSLRYGFKTDDSYESKQYNVQMYKDYLNNQDKLAYVRYKDVLNFNPKELYECGEDPLKLVEYYKNNQQLVKDAFVINSCLSNVHVTNDLKKALPTIRGPLEMLNQLDTKATAAAGIEYFACPPLNMEQIMMIRSARPDLFDINTGNETIKAICTDIENKELGTIHQFLDKFGSGDRKPEFGEGFFTKMKPIKTDPETEEAKEVTFAEYLKNKDNEDYDLDARDPFECDRIKMTSKTCIDRYAKEWQDEFLQHIPSHMNITKFDFSQIESETNGNVFQKIGRVFKGNSPQYDKMIQTLKDVNNPNHPDYMNDSKLRASAVDYLDLKHSQGYHEFNYKTIEGKRMSLAHAIIDTCDSSRLLKDAYDEIDEEIMDNYVNIKKQFLVNSDVEEVNVVENYMDQDIPSDVLENDDMELSN